MKLKEIILTVSVCALVSLAITAAVNSHEANRKLALAQTQIAADAKVIQAAKDTIAKADGVIKGLQAQAATEREALQSDAFTANLHAEQFRQQLNKIKSSTPNELGTTAVTLLGDGAQVRYNGTDFVVGVETFRLITERLADHSDFTLVREPAYKKTINDGADLVKNLDAQLAQKDVIISAKDRQIAGLEDTQVQLNKVVKDTKRADLITKIELTAAGFGSGVICGFLAGKKL